MPTRVPYTDVRDEWTPEVARGVARNFQELEQLPRCDYKVFTAGIGTTSSTAIVIASTFSSTVSVPGNAFVEVTAVLDCRGDVGVTNVGTLWSWGPNDSTYTSKTIHDREILFEQDAVDAQRATVGQTWALLNPEPGTWRFQVRLARAGSTALSAEVVNHNTLTVKVF